MEYSFSLEKVDAQSKHSSADDSFHSFLVEHDHFESYVLDPTDFYQQISLSFYGKRSRSFSPRNMHADSDKILERPKTPLKRLRKYPEEIKAINEILNNFSKINEVNNEKKNNFPFFPKINMPQRSPVDNKNDSKSINNIKNNINVRINFFMNGQNKEKDKITNEFQNADKKHKPNGLFYRSKSPESERSKIFINSSKNALQNLNATPLIFKDHKDLNKNGNPFDIKHSGAIVGVKKIHFPKNPPALLLETKKILDHYIDSKFKMEELHERTPYFKHQNYF